MRLITKDSEALLGRASENGRPQAVYSGCGSAIDDPKDVVDHLAILKNMGRDQKAKIDLLFSPLGACAYTTVRGEGPSMPAWDESAKRNF